MFKWMLYKWDITQNYMLLFLLHCSMCKMQNAPRENRQTVLAANGIVVFMVPDL